MWVLKLILAIITMLVVWSLLVINSETRKVAIKTCTGNGYSLDYCINFSR